MANATKIKMSIQTYTSGGILSLPVQAESCGYTWQTAEVSTTNPYAVCEALHASQTLFDPWDAPRGTVTANVSVQVTYPDGRTREIGGTHFVTLDGLRAVLNKFK